MASEILSVKNLSKVYGTIPALKNVSFSIWPSQIVGLLGPNGAGKTTTINMILSVLKPTTGVITIKGMDISVYRSEAMKLTNFAAVYAPLPGNLSVLQNLSIFARLYGVKDRTRRIKTLIERFDLTKFRNRKCGVLSSGEQTRVGIVKALLNEPALLLLDEPTSSIDPSVARTIRDHIREVVRDSNCAVLWTSHNMQEVEEVCDQVHFLFKGELLLSGDPKTLAKKHDKTNLEELFISLARKPLF